MTVKREMPSCHANELRALVLNEIPELRAVVDEVQVAPHPLMRALFDHTTSAIDKRDLPTVVRCFRLAKQLVDLAARSDSFVRSAIWASYVHRFRRSDPVAIELFHQIDPDVRVTLYSPVTFPHTWLRERKLSLPGSDRWRSWVTVAASMETEARRVGQLTCNGHFAIIRLRVEPMLDERTVLFCNRLDDAEDVPLRYVEDVIEGIVQSLVKRCDVDKGVAYLRIELLNLRHHPVDSRPSDFVSVGEQAVDHCIAERGLVEL